MDSKARCRHLKKLPVKGLTLEVRGAAVHKAGTKIPTVSPVYKTLINSCCKLSLQVKKKYMTSFSFGVYKVNKSMLSSIACEICIERADFQLVNASKVLVQNFTLFPHGREGL
jgi:hypothetical protein